MKFIFEDQNKRLIKEKEDISFTVESGGLYLIYLSARARGEKQLGSSDDEDLRVEIDGEKFPKLTNQERYFDSPTAFSGGQLHNLKKTVYFLLKLDRGKHTISLIPDISATFESLTVFQTDLVTLPGDLELSPNIQAEDGDRYPWIIFAFVNLAVSSLSVTLTLKRRFIDSDDVKVIIDGNTQKNLQGNLHKLWYFVASFFTGETQTATFTPNLPIGLHYIEFWADRMPAFNSIIIELGGTGELKLKQYKDDRFGRDYNQLDRYIIESTNFWNTFFLNQMYPPPEPLDPNLVKAVVYRESRLGYYPNKDIVDVMQVWDPANPVREAILGKTPANEFINPDRIGHIRYSYPADKIPPQVKTRQESIFWGIRWLFHKAQHLKITTTGDVASPYIRLWRNWKEAVKRYNANPEIVEEYVQEVFSVYENGIDLEGNQLW